MNRIRTIGRRIALLACLATGLLTATGAIPAFARPIPPTGGCGPCAPVAAAGMPGWELALIVAGAVVAVAATVVVAIVIHRIRAARRPVPASASASASA
jgi:hypothetical protein